MARAFRIDLAGALPVFLFSAFLSWKFAFASVHSVEQKPRRKRRGLLSGVLVRFFRQQIYYDQFGRIKDPRDPILGRKPAADDHCRLAETVDSAGVFRKQALPRRKQAVEQAGDPPMAAMCMSAQGQIEPLAGIVRRVFGPVRQQYRKASRIAGLPPLSKPV